MSAINFDYSPWFILLCLMTAAGLTYALYSKKAPWSAMVNKLLFGLRFSLLFIVTLLMLNPLFNQFVNSVEEPRFVIAVDNSLSMLNGADSSQIDVLLDRVGQLKQDLLANNYTVDIRTIDQEVQDGDEIEFDSKSSNLNGWLNEIQSDYEGTNLAAVYLISDGNYNQGISPAYFPFNFELNTIGIGDTTQKADLVLKNVLYNKIAYQGNKYPVIAEVINYGFEGSSSEVSVWQNGKLLNSKIISFDKKSDLQKVELEVDTENKGMQRLVVAVRPIDDESITSNNRQNIFVDIVDGKQKILLIAPSPHPDLKALAAVIEKNQNYELVTFIPGISDYKEDKYDLAIIHQAYDRRNKTSKYIELMKKNNVPRFYILGSQSLLNVANQKESHFFVSQRRNQKDRVFGTINSHFNKFSLSDVTNQSLSSFPPLLVAYGDYQLSQASDVLLYQKVGSITTAKPLLYVVEENNDKSGFMLADDFWKWRMQEYAITEKTETFDELFLKTIQYLSTKVDKRKFKFYPSKNEYFTNQTIQFQAELYNEIYERIYNEEVNVMIDGENGFSQQYSIIPVSSYSNLELTGFDEGTYQYTASVVLNNTKETVRGTFTVMELQLEQIDQVADFDMLRQLALNSNGRFYTYDDFSTIHGNISPDRYKGVIHTYENILPVINWKWLFLIILTLVGLEWFTRKYSGGY